MRLRITSNYPIEEVKKLVRFASKGVNHSHLTVWVKNSSSSFAGRYFHYGHVVARIGQPKKFPCDMQYPGLKRAPAYEVNNWQEAMVVVVAHELRHHFQHKHHKRMSEIDAERWAVKKLVAFRNS